MLGTLGRRSVGVKLAVAGRDERPRSSASGWVWVELGNRGWLKPPTPEEGSLDVNHSRGSILARQFKDGEVAASGDAPGIIGMKKRFSRKAAKTPREEG